MGRAMRSFFWWPLLLLSACNSKKTEPSSDADAARGSETVMRSAPAHEGSRTDASEAAAGEAVARVDLSGETQAWAINPPGSGPRVHARHLRAWIRHKPDRTSQRIGYLRAGQSVPTTGKPVSGPGCRGGWAPVAPRGYVCLGRRATLDATDPIHRAFEHHPPRFDTRLPYRYGMVRNPGVVFQRLPTTSEVEEAEPDYRERMPRWFRAGGEIGAQFRQEVWEWGGEVPDPRAFYESRVSRGIPEVLQGGARLPNPTLTPRPQTLVLERMPPRVGYAFLDTFFHEGRRYGLSTQLELIPTDRLRPIEGSDFVGVVIESESDLPFAFVRSPAATFSDGSKAEYRAVLSLSGKKVMRNGRLHYETRDGKYISDLHASEVRLANKMPGWGKRGEKWIDISIGRQLLMLYEGERPVYATLISSGEAGLESSEETSATKRGIFRIHTKHITATMSSDEAGEEFELRDVPYVQYFAEGGFALHGAYWHDRFGTPKSHGCINLSPEDARRLFWWTDPPVPLGWHASLSPLRGTVVFVHP